MGPRTLAGKASGTPREQPLLPVAPALGCSLKADWVRGVSSIWDETCFSSGSDPNPPACSRTGSGPWKAPRLNLALEWSLKQGAAAYHTCATGLAINPPAHARLSLKALLPLSRELAGGFLLPIFPSWPLHFRGYSIHGQALVTASRAQLPALRTLNQKP